MTRRVVAVLAAPGRGAAPPGVDDAAFAAAMLEDVVDLVTAMREVQVAVAAPVRCVETARGVVWPGTPLLVVAEGAPVAEVLDTVAAGEAAAVEAGAGEAGAGEAGVVEAGAGEAGAGEAAAVDEAAVVCADAPDLPPLLLGKLHSALTRAQVAVCPADGGGLVALAATLPVPPWLRASAVRLDDADALPRLRAVAPRGGLHVGPGWHRLRGPDDVARLDPGLEGWEATRALLGG